MNYYLLSLNNNICACYGDKLSGFYSYAKDYFLNSPDRDFRVLIELEIEIPGFLFIKPKTQIRDTYQKTNVKVLGFEQNGKIYDAITHKEIIYAKENEAHGECSTYFDCLTYSSKIQIMNETLADAVQCFLVNKENVSIYANCIKKVEEYNHLCYLNTKKLIAEKQESLVRSRSIIDEFQKKYGSK